MKRKINLQLVAIAILAVMATAIGITIVYYGLFQRQIRQDLMINAKLLRDTQYFSSTDIDVDSVDLSAENSELRVTWIDGDGTVLYDNDVDAAKLENHMDRPEIREAFETGEGDAVRKSDTLNEDTYYYAILLTNSTVLRIAANAQSLLAVFLSVMPVILLIIVLIITVCVILSFTMAQQILAPIEAMADHLENADYDAPYKELEPLARKLKSQHADVLAAAKARQDFTANVSHELKTPLTAISGYADLLQAGMVEEKQKDHLYGEITKNANRLLSLINDIIRLSEFDRAGRELTFEQIDLYGIAVECMDNLKVNAKQREISLTLEGNPCYINANPHMMRELIENLVQNAIRYKIGRAHV